MLNNLMTGLALMASAESFIAIFIGLLAGIIIGAIPGLTADIAIILCLPITYSMEPIPAMLLLLGLYCGGTVRRLHYCNFDQYTGYALERSDCAEWLSADAAGGEAAEGSDDGAVCLVFRWPVQCAGIAVCCTEHCTFHTDVWPSGYFCIAVFGLSIIASISNSNIIKGLLGGLIGIFIALLGQDSVSGTLRFTFECPSAGRRYPADRYAGRSVRNCRIAQPLDYNPRTDATRKQHLKLDHEKLSWAEIKRCLKTMTISSVIGTMWVLSGYRRRHCSLYQLRSGEKDLQIP